MAKKTTQTSSSSFLKKPKKRRAQIHAKTKMSKSKNSKNYKKLSVGQG